MLLLIQRQSLLEEIDLREIVLFIRSGEQGQIQRHLVTGSSRTHDLCPFEPLFNTKTVSILTLLIGTRVG